MNLDSCADDYHRDKERLKRLTQSKEVYRTPELRRRGWDERPNRHLESPSFIGVLPRDSCNGKRGDLGRKKYFMTDDFPVHSDRLLADPDTDAPMTVEEPMLVNVISPTKYSTMDSSRKHQVERRRNAWSAFSSSQRGGSRWGPNGFVSNGDGSPSKLVTRQEYFSPVSTLERPRIANQEEDINNDNDDNNNTKAEEDQTAKAALELLAPTDSFLFMKEHKFIRVAAFSESGNVRNKDVVSVVSRSLQQQKEMDIWTGVISKETLCNSTQAVDECDCVLLFVDQQLAKSRRAAVLGQYMKIRQKFIIFVLIEKMELREWLYWLVGKDEYYDLTPVLTQAKIASEMGIIVKKINTFVSSIRDKRILRLN